MIVKKKKTRFAADYSQRLKELYAHGKKNAPAATGEEKMAFTTQTQKDFAENNQICVKCQYFERYEIGDGTGIGNCLLNVKPTELKWLGTPACEQFEEKQ